MTTPRVLLGVSEPRRDEVAALLVSLGHEVSLAGDAEELGGLARTRAPHLLVVDDAFVEGAGTTGLTRLRALLPRTPLVLLPRSDEMPAEWPVRDLLASAERLSASSRVPPSPSARAPLDPFVGPSVAMRRLAEEAFRALPSDSPILLQGETGSGKGVLAAWLHRHGPRAHEPFVDLNCAGLSRELMDSELFGHEKGAFTGAIATKPGLLEIAHRGTLFLDEIGDMDPVIQAKLLKVIEERRFRRVGDTRERWSDARIVAATHQDLHRAVEQGRFRRDLYFRICVLPLRIPSLRARPEDVPPLARQLLVRLAADRGRVEPVLAADAEQALMRHRWPGNLRELRSVLERALLATERGTIMASDLDFDTLEPPHEVDMGWCPAGASLDEMERAYIVHVLTECGNDKELAARRLRMPRSTFYQRLAMMGLGRRAARRPTGA
jgi:DNA-binding NtrC family response regulator